MPVQEMKERASCGPGWRSPIFAILDVALLRLRVQKCCGLALNHKLPFPLQMVENSFDNIRMNRRPFWSSHERTSNARQPFRRFFKKAEIKACESRGMRRTDRTLQ
jgi:hypothetical protein